MDSFQDLKEKYMFHNQKQVERTKKATRQSKFMEISQKSNVKLLALQKVLKAKMDEKKKEKYEKRLLMYKIANEEETADYEKFFDENESECEFNDEEKENPIIDEDNDCEEKVEKNLKDEENSNDKDLNEENLEEQSDEDLNDENLEEQSDEDLNDENLEEQSDEDLNDENLEEQSDEDLNDENLEEQKISQDNTLEDQSIGMTPSDLIDQNRDIVTKMINKVQQSQLDNEELLGLCSAKVATNEFIDDSMDDDSMNEDRFNKDKVEESFLNDEIKLSSINGDQNDDIFDNLNSQDSQFENNKESTFLETRSNIKKTPFMNIKDFIEDQAELSDEDKDEVSSDEDEDSNDEYEQDEIDENLPSNDEILKENNKMFLKQQMDEDRREILEYQERFLEYGDLHEDGEVRQRKFKWKNIDNVWVDNVKDSSDSDEFDICDSQIEYTSLHLKQLTEMDKTKLATDDKEDNCSQTSVDLNKDERRKKKLMNTSLNKTHLSSYSTFNNSIFEKHMRTFKRTMVNGPANDIKSYIIKDKNLVNAMSIKSSAAANQVKSKPRNQDYYVQPTTNKKRKVDKNEDKKSIFDLF